MAIGALGNLRCNLECSLVFIEGVLEALLMSIGDGDGNGELGEYGRLYLEVVKWVYGNGVFCNDECNLSYSLFLNLLFSASSILEVYGSFYKVCVLLDWFSLFTAFIILFCCFC